MTSRHLDLDLDRAFQVIARGLRDVVVHRISLIAVLAETAPQTGRSSGANVPEPPAA